MEDGCCSRKLIDLPNRYRRDGILLDARSCTSLNLKLQGASDGAYCVIAKQPRSAPLTTIRMVLVRLPCIASWDGIELRISVLPLRRPALPHLLLMLTVLPIDRSMSTPPLFQEFSRSGPPALRARLFQFILGQVESVHDNAFQEVLAVLVAVRNKCGLASGANGSKFQPQRTPNSRSWESCIIVCITPTAPTSLRTPTFPLGQPAGRPKFALMGLHGEQHPIKWRKKLTSVLRSLPRGDHPHPPARHLLIGTTWGAAVRVS
ncbi:uncharacterized protein EV422DRAFT_233334 [Fimicolochytrium jonesii]|uniref:uncharacterized protein n=1 Tax=Fimicolochytrium jonesii TaxID=1396493 RepID=UPI0022FE34D4|nr:uncharacterized protein EV422DRAFT_233334 [Fimicolochytrium jonesii]KAI8824782.1 hypothetical protein EV422DRAFT_233334 [Fimicolochytrium jonesii]